MVTPLRDELLNDTPHSGVGNLVRPRTRSSAFRDATGRGSALYHRADHAAWGDFTAVSGFFACAS
jgi:hypothetical protein